MKTIDTDNKTLKIELKKMTKNMFNNLVKFVVDIEKEILV